MKRPTLEDQFDLQLLGSVIASRKAMNSLSKAFLEMLRVANIPAEKIDPVWEAYSKFLEDLEATSDPIDRTFDLLEKRMQDDR